MQQNNQTKFKETEIGTIPEEWDVLPIAKLPIKIGDGNYSSKYPNMEELVGVGIPFISAKDIKDGKIRSDELRFISPELHSTLTKGHIKKGDTLIVTRADVGRVGLVTEEYEDANINAQLVFLRPDGTTVNKVFLYYLLSSSNYFDLLRNFSSGSAQSQLPIKAMNEIPIVLPSIVEQKQIAEILSSLDDEIELNRKINENLEKIASTLFKHWFVNFESPDKNGKPYKSSSGKMVDSELGLIPEGWKIRKLGEVVNIAYGKGLPADKLLKNGYPVFGGNGVIGSYNKYLYKEPQIIIGCRGAGSGNIKQTYPKSFVTNNSLVLEIPKESDLNRFYLKYFLRTVGITEFVTGSAQPQITIENLKHLKFLIPAFEILKKFADVVSEFDGSSLNNELKIKNLQIIRDSLLPKLMRGKIRV